MTKTRSVEEFETSLVQLYYKSDILFKYNASRNFEWNRKRELEWDRIFTVLRKLHNKEVSKIKNVFQLKTKIWKLIQMTKKKYQRHLLFPAYPKSFSKVEKLILKYEGIAPSALPQAKNEQDQNIQPQNNNNENESIQKSKDKVEYWLSYKFILPKDHEGTSESEILSSPTSLFFAPHNPFEIPSRKTSTEILDEGHSDETSTQQLLESNSLGFETEEKLLYCNSDDSQVSELLQILKENEIQNAEINALRLERERLELEEAKIRLKIAEEDAMKMNQIQMYEI